MTEEEKKIFVPRFLTKKENETLQKIFKILEGHTLKEVQNIFKAAEEVLPDCAIVPQIKSFAEDFAEAMSSCPRKSF